MTLSTTLPATSPALPLGRRVVSCNREGRLWVRCGRSGRWILVDTGACATVCNMRFVHQYELSVTPRTTTPLYSACGQQLRAEGTTEVSLIMPWGEAIKLDVLVLTSLREEFIIGRDVIEAKRWLISVEGCEGGKVRTSGICNVCSGGGQLPLPMRLGCSS